MKLISHTFNYYYTFSHPLIMLQNICPSINTTTKCKLIKITEYSINHRLMEYVLSTQINLFNYVPLLLLGQRDLPAFPPRCSSFTDQSHSLIPQLLLQVLVVHRIVWATAIHQHILFWFIRKILVRSSSTAHRHGSTSSLQNIH